MDSVVLGRRRPPLHPIPPEAVPAVVTVLLTVTVSSVLPASMVYVPSVMSFDERMTELYSLEGAYFMIATPALSRS